MNKSSKEKKAQYQREYRAKNPDRVRQHRKKYDTKNAEKIRQYKKAYCAKNAEKMKRVSMEWRKNNPKKWLAIQLRNKYGITIEQMVAAMEKQNHGCAICGYSDTSNPRYFPYVDHCHTTGKFRGVLCATCNTGLGLFKDSSELLKTAALYIEDNK